MAWGGLCQPYENTIHSIVIIQNKWLCIAGKQGHFKQLSTVQYCETFISNYNQLSTILFS